MKVITGIILLLGIGIGQSQPVTAQDSLFAYVNNPKSTRSLPKLVEDYKYETAKQVFDQLIQARGDTRMPVPKFVMNKGERYVAWMNPVKTEIGLEETAYNVCARLGSDSLTAIAALLAHEVTHYYENHSWSRNFVRTNKELGVSAKIEELEEGLKFEVQADYLGGILAISAGYNTYSVLDTFLKSAYEIYDLPEEIDGYPSLTERLKMSKTTAGRLRKLHNVYQTANLLTLIEAHSIANQYYKFILSDYQSYEVYNNAGVNACLGALQLMNPKEIPYAFPLELDMTSRLDGLNTRAVEDTEKRRNELLKDAEAWFKSAMQMAPEQSAAYLNLSVVYTLKKEWLDASYWASKALALSQRSGHPKQAADAQVALGIIAGIQGDEQEAKTKFTMALAGNKPLAQTNLSVLEGISSVKTQDLRPAKGVETIEGLFLEDFLQDPQLTVTADLPNDVYCGKKILDHSEFLLHYAKEGEEYVLFHQTCPSYQGHTQWGIQHGAGLEEILQIYKDPTKTLELTNGRCLIYKEQKILFIFNEQNRLRQWVVFAAKQ